MKYTLNKTITPALVILLSACGVVSGEPSASDIETAVSNEVAGLPAVYRPKSVKKIGCSKDGDRAYKCDLEITSEVSGETKTKVGNFRFVKTSNGWAVTK